MRTILGSRLLLALIAIVFGLELAKGAIGSDPGLLGLGALPDSGELHGQYWRLISFGFLHFDVTHVALNAALLFWVGPIVERRVGTAWFMAVFMSASVMSGIGILLKHQLWPAESVSVGASGGVFGLLGAALVLVFRVPSQRHMVRVWLTLVLVGGLAYSFLPGVSMIGHVCGLIVGATAALFITPATPAASVAGA
jgi:membrane associated rhomboid family serine protease